MGKLKPPKPISYLLIPADSDIGRPMYERLYRLVDTHHEELSQTNVRLALAWATSWKPDVDGRLVLGKCKKATDLDRELAPFDFVVLLNRDFWQNPRVTDSQRDALLDHELMHAAIARDENGDPKIDEKGRTVYRVRKHDIEEFRDIVARHGCYKADLEAFARAITRAESQSLGQWISYSAVQETLLAIGLDVPKAVIAMWPDDERREVHTWALLRADDAGKRVDATLSQTMPACLAAAVRPDAGAAAH